MIKRFKFELFRYFKTNRTRLIITSCLIFIICLYTFNQILPIAMPDDWQMSFHDLMFGIFGTAAFVMSLIFPILFSILIADLVMKDVNKGYINMILARSDDRMSYILSKLAMVVILALFFISVIFMSGLLIAVIHNLPFSGTRLTIISYMTQHTSLSRLYWDSVILFGLGLLFVGLLTIVISLFVKTASIAVILIIIIAYLQNVVRGFAHIYDSIYGLGWWDSTANNILAIMPFFQYISGLHVEFEVMDGLPVSFFTLTFSHIYLVVGNIIFFLLVHLKVNGIEID